MSLLDKNLEQFFENDKYRASFEFLSLCLYKNNFVSICIFERITNNPLFNKYSSMDLFRCLLFKSDGEIYENGYYEDYSRPWPYSSSDYEIVSAIAKIDVENSSLLLLESHLPDEYSDKYHSYYEGGIREAFEEIKQTGTININTFCRLPFPVREWLSEFVKSHSDDIFNGQKHYLVDRMGGFIRFPYKKESERNSYFFSFEDIIGASEFIQVCEKYLKGQEIKLDNKFSRNANKKPYKKQEVVVKGKFLRKLSLE